MRRYSRYIGSVLYFGVLLCAPALAASPDPADSQENSRSVSVHRMSTFSTGLSDEAIMVLAGTALIGVAAAVRRAA